MSVGKVYSQSSGERYFEQTVDELIRASLVVLSNAGEQISITSLHSFISSLPIEREQVDSPSWQESSECSRVIANLKARKDSFSPSAWSDLDIAIVFLLEKWPNLDPRTRSNIESAGMPGAYQAGISKGVVKASVQARMLQGNFPFSG